MTTRIALTLGLALSLAPPAIGQSGLVRTTINPPGPMEAVTRQPYSYELVSETTQTLADGTHISHPARTARIFQDVAGRRRTERPFVQTRSSDVAIIEIYDVVAGYRYVLDVENKIAHRSAIPPLPKGRRPVGGATTSSIASAATNPGGGYRVHSTAFGDSFPGPDCGMSPCPPPIVAVEPFAPSRTPDAPQLPEPTGKSLGTRKIEGVECAGRLNKSIYPPGAIGNERALIRTTETWLAKGLNLVMLSKSNDPRIGESIEQIKNLSRAQPEASLFQPPPDYKVVDETGPFQLTITLH